MVSLTVATRNEHKLKELRELLPGVDLCPIAEQIVLPPEVGADYRENALAKARAARPGAGGAVIGEDSGIEAIALGGAPGIRSARYAGPSASDEENLAKLFAEVATAGDDRRVAYVCAIALVDEDGSEVVFAGRCEGMLADTPRGTGGFGYDPAFVPLASGPKDKRTMAELGAEEKNRISHRGAAARLLAAHLAARGQAEGGGR